MMPSVSQVVHIVVKNQLQQVALPTWIIYVYLYYYIFIITLREIANKWEFSEIW